MKNERTLSFNMSQKISHAELESVSAAGMTSRIHGSASYGHPTGGDADVELVLDP